MEAENGRGASKERFWNRHSNPKSGWSRLLSYPVLMATIYLRKPRAFLATVAFLLVNPILFPEPDESAVDDWMYRGVRAEEFWTDEGRSLVGVGYPQILNVLNAAASGYALVSAVRRKPVGTVVGTLTTMALKLWFIQVLIGHHEAARGGAVTRGTVGPGPDSPR